MSAKDLRFRAELKFVILWVVLDNPLVLVEVAQVFVLIRISMVIERKHFLVRPIDWLGLKWYLRAVVAQESVDVPQIYVLQVLKIDALKELFLLLGHRGILLLFVQLIYQLDLLTGQLYRIAFFIVHYGAIASVFAVLL